MADKPVVIVDPSFRKMTEIFSETDLDRLAGMAQVAWGKDEPMPKEQFEKWLPEASAVICSDWKYGPVLERARKLKAIFVVSGGFPNDLDYQQCFERRIRVLSVAPAFARQVAEMALGMTLAACREIVLGDRLFRQSKEQYLWSGNTNTFMLYDKTVGIIGFGNIARELRLLLEPFHVQILAYDPWLGDGYLRHLRVEPVTIENLLQRSQVIFVLAVPSSENRAFLTRPMLEMIQPGAVFALMSRAHVVDFEALTELVLAGRFRAAIDVFPKEPFPENHPIRKAEDALFSAHRAGSVKEGLWEIGEMVLDDLEAVLQGLPSQRLQLAQPELITRFNTQKAQ